MKKSILIGIFFVTTLAKSQDDAFSKQLSKISESEIKVQFPAKMPSYLASISNYDVAYYRCEWKVDPAVKYIEGKITTYFKPAYSSFDTINFNLSDSLIVDSIKFHGNPLVFSHASNIISCTLPFALPAGVLDSVCVFYQGKPASTGFGSFMQATHSTTNSTPIIWTLSEPYGASDWWPCKNNLTDKADSMDVIVTSPSAYRTASNGLLVSDKINGTERICHWKHRYPIADYLICFATTNYAEYSNYVPFNSTNLFVQSFVYPEDSALVAAQTVADIPIMQLYDTLFGVYPFVNEKYGHVECGKTMEHQTMSFFGETSFGFETLAHELAHHWFGNKITCASWEDIWLNEGFATYLSGLAYEHMLGGVWWMPFKKSRIDDITSLPGGSVFCDDTTDVNRIFNSRLSYAKGAMILHQIRWIFGDSVFFSAINNYLNDPLLAYGFARTSDLKHHFEISSGQNLDWYFNDWFTGKGFPSYQINWNQTGNTVNLAINQIQSDPSVSFFELPLPIQFKNQTNDTIIRFNNTVPGESFSVNIPFVVDSVKLDPDLWLITANNTISSVPENDILSHISIYPNPVQEEIQIDFSRHFERMDIRLMDMMGREIKTLSTDTPCHISMNCEDINEGLYILRFDTGAKTISKKIIILR